MELKKKLVDILKSKGQTIAIMESCTGGGLANEITNISGASEVFEFGAVTYSNKSKIMLGKEKMNETIEKYSVYSKETAEVMAEAIATLANSTFGIGITGQLEKKTNEVDFSIYNSNDKSFDTVHLTLADIDRKDNKIVIINQIIERLLKVV